MGLVIAIDLIAVITLVAIAQSKGLERALPIAAFVLVLVPIESSIPLPFFELTTHRLIIAVMAILYMTRPRGAPSITGLPLKGLLIVHVAWCLISTANSIVPDQSLKKLLSVLLEYYLLYVIYVKTISKVETIQKIVMAMVAAIVVCSMWGVGEAYRGWYILPYFPPSSHHFDVGLDADRDVRVQATFDHPILYGAALAMAITLAFYLFTVVKGGKSRTFLWVGLMLMFLNIYKTSSRGPWLDAILGCFMLMILAKNGIRTQILTVGALAAMVLIARPGVWDTIRNMYSNTLNTESDTGSSYAYRFALQDAAINRIAHSPAGRAIWGFGLESFYDLKIEGELLGKPWLFLSCDNSWVELMLETGYVGLGLIAILLFKPVFAAWRMFLSIKEDVRYLALLFFVNFLIFYFQMYSVGMYSWGQNGYMLWIMIAMTMVLPFCRTQEAAGEEPAEEPQIMYGRPEWQQQELIEA